jgi:catechol 2,3-dioxygenase-like lactoylglutathione lyase family enzyme
MLKSSNHERKLPMNRQSAVDFATNTRIHIALATKDLDRATSFYRVLFGQEPSKTRPGYAKFEVVEPPVNLSLNQVGGETGPSNSVAHFGIQVKSTNAVIAMKDRVAAAGLELKVEENVSCCYAVQDKIWVADPDGNKWEVFVVLDNESAQHMSSAGSCCPDTIACCTDVSKEPAELVTLGCCR